MVDILVGEGVGPSTASGLTRFDGHPPPGARPREGCPHGDHGQERRPRRSFSKEFKAEVVELVRHPGNTAGSGARRCRSAGGAPPGRTEATIASSSSSNTTPSTTVRSTPSRRSHSLAFRTPLLLLVLDL